MEPAQAKKNASSNWSVTVNGDTPAKPAVKPGSGTVQGAAQKEPAAKPKPVVLKHPAAGRTADLDKIMAPPPSGSKLMPVAVGVAVLLLICAAAANVRSKHKAAAQQAAQASATVTAFINRVEELKKQAPSFHRQLDELASDLQPIAAASSPDKAYPPRINNAILTLAKVEKALFDGESDGEQVMQALAELEQRPEHPALAEKVLAARNAYKALQKEAEAKCQKVRSLIMSAEQHVPK
jgi:hypothetical protein